MAISWATLFDEFGIKQVSKTDKKKGAYVPNASQKAAIRAAGIKPARGNPFTIHVLRDEIVNAVSASFYLAKRSHAAARTPEARMGFEFISTWLKVGDEVVIGNIGHQLFAAKTKSAQRAQEFTAQKILRQVEPNVVLARAMEAKGKPSKKATSRVDFVRNPYVVRATIVRSDGKCEMPSCARPLFTTDDGAMYLEVHHVIPLAEGGDDAMGNTAALCPHCHRMLHYGKDRLRARRAVDLHCKSLPGTLRL